MLRNSDVYHQPNISGIFLRPLNVKATLNQIKWRHMNHLTWLQFSAASHDTFNCLF